jgi:hypothetical protein
VLGLAGTSLTAALGLGWVIDPNLVSFHGFYRARLARAYLGASNPHRARTQADITDAVAGDDLPLATVANTQRGAPYHLINATLNLTASRDLATRQRVAAHFLLSPLYCGSPRTGFRPTSRYMGGSLSLATAVAISGAAASPVAGTLRLSSAQAMLFTLLNIRLGFWAPNPRKSSWSSPQAQLWPFLTLWEFLSQTDGNSLYCYLSDGGHFENSSLYGLVQRACQVIVVVDCGQDPSPLRWSDLGNAIRMCRLDFGAEIDIDVSGVTSESPVPAVKGRIRYSPEHLAQLGLSPEEIQARSEGTLIWVKPIRPLASVLRGECADVLQYASVSEDFPQQSTADLSYDEAQFESYRKWGSWTAELAAPLLQQALAGRQR